MLIDATNAYVSTDPMRSLLFYIYDMVVPGSEGIHHCMHWYKQLPQPESGEKIISCL